MSIRIALVTGGNRGLGLETARQLARRGYRVVLAARDLDKAEVAAEMLRGEQLDLVPHQLDVASGESCARLSQLVELAQPRGDIDDAPVAAVAHPGGERLHDSDSSPSSQAR